MGRPPTAELSSAFSTHFSFHVPDAVVGCQPWPGCWPRSLEACTCAPVVEPAWKQQQQQVTCVGLAWASLLAVVGQCRPCLRATELPLNDQSPVLQFYPKPASAWMAFLGLQWGSVPQLLLVCLEAGSPPLTPSRGLAGLLQPRSLPWPATLC